MRYIEINGRKIGSAFPPYIVAELSANHSGDLSNAKKLILAAKEANASAVKIQTYKPETITMDNIRPEFMITQGPRSGMTLFELYSQGSTPWEWHEELFQYAKDIGITIFSSPFDITALELLESLDCCAYKIASFELVDLPLIRAVASTGKPVIMSTGLADVDEILEAIAVAKDEGNKDLIVLHCVSGYPTPVREANIRTISDLNERTGCIVGLSDHTVTTDTAVAAVALGASFIEKHFKLADDESGLDASFSLDPGSFKELVHQADQVWQSLGEIDYSVKPSESYTYRLRRSLYADRDIEAGELVGADGVRSIRPSNGLAPKHYDTVIMMRARDRIKKGTPLNWDLLIAPHKDA